ncbi:MAG: SAM-dependent chlorinase/fluorinase [Desulfobacterales bacterium]
MTRIITLTTDFGLEDEYVGVMKGVILSICPAATIVDITHGISPQNRIQAAYIIDAAYRYFPAGTIHLAVVDPGVGTGRAMAALRADGHVFLAPDNGVLSFLLQKDGIFAVRLNRSEYFLKDVSTTFHGRDVFAPAAAHLAAGVDLEALGEPVDCGALKTLDLGRPRIGADGRLSGTVVWADRFGNLTTSIDAASLDAYLRSKSGSAQPVIRIGEYRIAGLSSAYADAEPGRVLALIGSRGYLEISVNRGNAHKDLRINNHDPVFVE